MLPALNISMGDLMFFLKNRHDRYDDIDLERIVLREPELSDAEDVYEFCSNPAASRYSDWEPHRSVYDSKDYIAYLKSRKQNKEMAYTWFAELKETGKVIGTVSVIKNDSTGLIRTVGYTFSEKFHHKGYATEALRGLVKYLFSEKGVVRIEAKVMPQNLPSVKLLKRVGFENEGISKRGAVCRNQYVDVYIFRLTAKMYRL